MLRVVRHQCGIISGAKECLSERFASIMFLQSSARDLTGIRESVGRYASKVLDHARDAHVSKRY